MLCITDCLCSFIMFHVEQLVNVCETGVKTQYFPHLFLLLISTTILNNPKTSLFTYTISIELYCTSATVFLLLVVSCSFFLVLSLGDSVVLFLVLYLSFFVCFFLCFFIYSYFGRKKCSWQ